MVAKTSRPNNMSRNILFLLAGLIGALIIILIVNAFARPMSKTDKNSNLLQNESEEIVKTIENKTLEDYLATYGLYIEKIEDSKVVISDKEYDCILYIYPVNNIREELEYNVKNYYPKVVFENISAKKEVYILFNEERLIYRLLAGYNYPLNEFNNYLVFVTTCWSFNRTKDVHLKIADQLIDIYKKYILKR